MDQSSDSESDADTKAAGPSQLRRGVKRQCRGRGHGRGRGHRGHRGRTIGRGRVRGSAREREAETIGKSIMNRKATLAN